MMRGSRNPRGFLHKLSLLSLGAATSLISCRGATEITLRVHTNLPCEDEKRPWKGVAVYVGKPGQDVEEASPTLVTRTCDADGNIGSLVVVPSGSRSAAVGLRVVAGLDVQPEDCRKADYVGCIVARRTLRFTPHDGLDLDVELTSDCVGVACTATSTCRLGGCETAVVKDLPEPDPTPAVDQPSVRCGDDGVRCPAGDDNNTCCLSVDAEKGTTQGDCRPSDLCPPSSVALHCDDDSDCPKTNSAGVAEFCMLTYTQNMNVYVPGPGMVPLSECRPFSLEGTGTHWPLGLCEKRTHCVNGTYSCRDSQGNPFNPLPRYHWCETTIP